MTILPNSLEARDVAYYFHPATNARRHEQIGPLVIESGHGVFVRDDQGNDYIEGLAGLWSVALGFGEKRLAEVAARQMAKLPYYHSFGGKSHPEAIVLAERLVKLAGGKLAKAQFTSSGSEANDFVVKLVWYYNNALGRTKKKTIISRQRGYHGVSIASGSLTGMPNFHREFDLPLPFVRHLTAPHYWRHAEPGESEEAFSARLGKEFEALIAAEGAETIAAFIGEPLMGAGGVIPSPSGYLADDAGDLPQARHPPDRRRGHNRFRALGDDVRRAEIRDRARHHGPVESADLILLSAIGGVDFRRPLSADRGQFGQDRRVRPRLHRERPSCRHGGGDGEPRHHRGARSRRGRGPARAAIPGAPRGIYFA
jgi:hypothetical protein